MATRKKQSQSRKRSAAAKRPAVGMRIDRVMLTLAGHAHVLKMDRERLNVTAAELHREGRGNLATHIDAAANELAAAIGVLEAEAKAAASAS